MEKTIYDLKLHEILIVEGKTSDNLFTTAMRVPRGWIYRSYDKSHNMMGVVFVGFDNEFQAAQIAQGEG